MIDKGIAMKMDTDFGNGKVETTLTIAGREIAKWVVDTHEDQIRAALTASSTAPRWCRSSRARGNRCH